MFALNVNHHLMRTEGMKNVKHKKIMKSIFAKRKQAVPFKLSKRKSHIRLTLRAAYFELIRKKEIIIAL